MKKRLNLKRLLKKRNKSGFTLIEVVIAMALLGLLVMGVVTFASPILTMVAYNKKNAQANMLSESINTYIMGQIRSARIVEVFSGQDLEYVMSSGLDDPGGYGGNISTLFTPGSTYADENEIRCIGMVWVDDDSATGAGRKKLMLVNCVVNRHLQIQYVEKVFDDSLYSGLYPTLRISPIETSSGAISENGYEITSQIYTTPSCYNALSTDARSRSGANFTGTTYVQCVNLSAAYSKMGHIYSTNYTSGSLIPSTLDSPKLEKVYAREEICLQQSIEHWAAGDDEETPATNKGYYENGTHYFYPDTLIYYVVPK